MRTPCRPRTPWIAGVAGGGGDDVELAARLGQDVFEEVAEELERDVLEGEGGPVEEFEDVDGADLPDGRDFGVAERGVAAIDDSAQGVCRDVVGEEPHDFEGEIRVAEIRPSGETIRDVGEALGQEEAAVAGEPRHDG